MDDATGYETLYELLKALQRTSLETTDPEILAIDCWEAFRTAVHEALAEGRAPKGVRGRRLDRREAPSDTSPRSILRRAALRLAPASTS